MGNKKADFTPKEIDVIDSLIRFGENNEFFYTLGDDTAAARRNARAAESVRRKLGIDEDPIEVS